MNSVLDSQAIAIPCPKCGHKLSQTIGKLKTKPDLTCPKCRTQFKGDTADMRPEIAKAEKAVADFKRTLSRLGK